MAAVEIVAAIGFVIDVVVCLVAVVNANVAGNVAIVVSVAVVCNVDVVVDVPLLLRNNFIFFYVQVVRTHHGVCRSNKG